MGWTSPTSKFLLACLLSWSCARAPGQSPQTVPGPPAQESARSVLPSMPGPTQAGGTYLDRSAEYGLMDLAPTSLAAVDYDRDGFTDLVAVENYLSIPAFYRFDPIRKRFMLDTKPPLLSRTLVSFIIFADMNGDGVLDALTSRLNQRDDLTREKVRVHLARKSEGRWVYEELPNAVPLPAGPTTALLPVDLNVDGKLDLFVGQWFGPMDGHAKAYPDQILIGLGDGRFEAPEAPPGESKSFALPTLSVSSCDLDLDGRPDILASTSHGQDNRMWMNTGAPGGGGYVLKDMARETGYAADPNGMGALGRAGNTHFSACADYNNDQIMDLVVGEQVDPLDDAARDRSAILTGSSRQFPFLYVRSEFDFDDARMKGGYAHRRGVWADMDNDGLLDLILDDSGHPPLSRLVLLHQRRDHLLEDVARERGVDVLNPSATIVMDVNKDGLLDIITGQVSTRATGMSTRTYVFIQKKDSSKGRRLVVNLRGQRSNTQGLGATLVLKTSAGKQMRYVEYAQGAPPSQLPEGQWFGIPKGAKLIELEVRWPGRGRPQKIPLGNFSGSWLNVHE